MSKVTELGDKIKSIKKIYQLTQAMQVVAAAQLKKVQQRQRRASHYQAHYERVVSRLGLELKSPPKASPVVLLYVFGSERGFCGGVNQTLAASLPALAANETARLVVVGKKCGEVFQAADIRSVFEFADLASLALEAHDLFMSGAVAKVYLCYNQFKSMLVQQPVSSQVLPLLIKPVDREQALVEPSLVVARQFAALNYLQAVFYDAFMQSRLGEVASRLMTMRSASENAKDIITNLQIKFNKARQAMITVELSEILSSFEILNEGVG